jgi:hypothetical protein
VVSGAWTYWGIVPNTFDDGVLTRVCDMVRLVMIDSSSDDERWEMRSYQMSAHNSVIFGELPSFNGGLPLIIEASPPRRFPQSGVRQTGVSLSISPEQPRPQFGSSTENPPLVMASYSDVLFLALNL